MPVPLLEINDCGLQFWRDGERHSDSPGYALLRGGRIELGDAARDQAHRYPASVENQFWQRLSLSPLARPKPRAAHDADLAYLHLEHLWRQCGKPEPDILVATPGHYSDEQLSLLLGIFQHGHWRVGGLVDAATLSAAGQLAEGERGLHLELQLHQCVLSSLAASDGQLSRRAVQTIPGGLLSMLRRWAACAAAAFLRQHRYDPMHSPEAEQQLYQAVRRWAEQAPRDAGMMTLSIGDAARHANMPAEEWRGAIAENLALLAESVSAQRERGGERLLLSSRVGALGALSEGLGAALSIEERQMHIVPASSAARYARRQRERWLGDATRPDFIERVENSPDGP